MSRQVVATVAGAVLICAACGAEAPTGSPDVPVPSPTDVAAVLPATTLFVRPPADVPSINSVLPAAGGQPCPPSDASSDGGDGMFAELSRVEPMLGQVLAYGSERPDQFGSYGLVWHAGDDASVVISFTSDLDVHRTALEAIVAHPDDLVVCQAAVSGEVAQAIAATLVDELDGRFLSIGRGIGPVEVGLAPDEEMLAGELLARYGEAIDLTVGALAYPIENAVSVCAAAPDPNPLPGLEIELHDQPDSVTADGHGRLDLAVTLTNVGDAPIRFSSGTATGTILDLGGNPVSSSDSVAIADVGMPVDLAPGASTELPLAAGTFSCDLSLGYAVPPGNYHIVVAIPHDGATLYSAPLPIMIAG